MQNQPVFNRINPHSNQLKKNQTKIASPGKGQGGKIVTSCKLFFEHDYIVLLTSIL